MTVKLCFAKSSREFIDQAEALGLNIYVSEPDSGEIPEYYVEVQHAFLTEERRTVGDWESISAFGSTPSESLMNLRKKFEATAISGYLAVETSKDAPTTADETYALLKFNPFTRTYNEKGTLKL